MSTSTAAAPVTPASAGAPGVAGAFPMHPSGSLYVGDLSSDVTEAHLFEIFSRVGAVSSIRVCRDSTSRRSLGYAYVNFHSVMDAERALDTMNYQNIRDRPCRIMWSHRDPASRKNNKSNVFIKNLAPGIDSKQLYDTFSKFGSILSCKVATDPMTGQSRGFGYVHFETEDSAKKAIDATNGHEIAGKPVYVGPFERRTDRQTGVTKYTNIYIKNIPAEWDEKKLTDEFSKFGKVTSLALRKDEKHGGAQYAFVNYDSHEEALKAVENARISVPSLFVDRFQKRSERSVLLGKLFEDRRREKSEKFKNLNLYVKNLDDDFDNDKLRELFTPHGEITSAVVMRDDKGASRGFGFVCFASVDDATKALEALNGHVIGSKPLYVNRAQRKEERRNHLEHSFIAGQRMQPVMYFPPMQPQYVMQPPFRRTVQQMGQMPPMRAYPTTQYYQPQAGNAGGRGRGRGAAPQQGQRGGYPSAIGRGGALRGAPQQMRNMSNPRQQAQPQYPPHQELSMSMLAAQAPEMQKQILGEKLYPMVHKVNEKQAAKITGMFLEMEIPDILALLESQAELNARIAEAMTVLDQTNQM